jgi:small subunit ribosomal protein S6
VLSPTLDDDAVNAVVGQVTELVGREGGSVSSTGQLADKRGNVVEVTEGWRTRRLAYTIDGKRDGYFVVIRLQAPPGAISELERVLHINESVLRHMVLRTDA